MSFSSNKSGPGLHRPLADINVTPLVDVMLVLLIVFMITAPMLTTGLKMDLPQARSSVTLKPKPPLVISVTKEGKLMLDMDELTFDQLVPVIQKKMDGDINRIIQIRGDRNSSYGSIFELIDKLVMNGFTRIALVSDPKARQVGASNK
jgi:biopolymer transport protein TolR